MKKSKFVILGIALILISIASLFGNIIITGNVIGSSLVQQTFSFLTILGFISGILIASFGDPVQEWLETKEKESSSPSSRLRKQTLGEKIHFLKRKLAGGFYTKRNEPSAMEKEENERRKELADEETYSSRNQRALYSKPLTPQQTMKLSFWEHDKELKEEKAKANESEIRKVRNDPKYGLLGELKKINQRISEGADFPTRRQDIDEQLSKLDRLYSSLGMEFAREPYEKMLKEKGTGAAEILIKKLEKYVTSNDSPVNEGTIRDYISRASNWLNLGNQDFSSEGRSQLFHRVVKKYVDETKTVPVSEASEKNDVTLVHGIPYFKDGSGRYPQFYNNDYWRRNKDLTKHETEMTLEDFLDHLFSHKPDLSASAIRKDSAPQEFYSPFGVIIKEGKIYDADSQDIAALGKADREKIRMRLNSGTSEPISERVKNTVRSRPTGNGYNELIIGDNHTIGGIYFVEGHRGWNSLNYQGQSKNEIIKRLASEAKKYNVPLYSHSEGKGFSEINVGDYLHERHGVSKEKVGKGK